MKGWGTVTTLILALLLGGLVFANALILIEVRQLREDISMELRAVGESMDRLVRLVETPETRCLEVGDAYKILSKLEIAYFSSFSLEDFMRAIQNILNEYSQVRDGLVGRVVSHVEQALQKMSSGDYYGGGIAIRKAYLEVYGAAVSLGCPIP